MTELEYLQQAEKLRGKLYGTALLTLGSQAAAVDAVDEAVYKGYCNYGRLRQPEFFSTWLTRILINVCRDELRRRKREISMAQLPEVRQEELDTLPLKEAIGKLPQPLAEVVILRYFTGLTLEETARVLKLPRGTVSTRQRRALELLKLELSDEEVRV